MGRNKSCYYCYECLGKYPRKPYQDNPVCPHCDAELRLVSHPRVRAGIVTKLRKSRGLDAPKKGRYAKQQAKRDYKSYLESDQWREIRDRVLLRDSNTCQDCGSPANQVHHMSYAQDVMEGRDDSKLVSLCRECHEKRHPEIESRKAARNKRKAKRQKKHESNPQQ